MKEEVTRDYVNHFSKITLTQPLKIGGNIQQIFSKNSGGKSGRTWKVTHVSNTMYHICQFDGVFRECASCERCVNGIDETNCKGKRQVIAVEELVDRCNDCIRAGLSVEFE